MIYDRTKHLVGFDRALVSLRLVELHLGDELAQIVNSRYGYVDYEYGIANASTDFVSLCLYLVPLLFAEIASCLGTYNLW